ncbi:MAG: DUF6108 family protein [Bacteroidia bacterium]|nr:DUF6108 family protein [Bacteroidia bacterium]
MNKRLTILFFVLTTLCSISYAQEGLNINKIFENPNEYDGYTDEVRIKGKALKQYNLTFFHSLTLSGSNETADIMESLARKDSEGAESIKEIVRGNRTMAIYCQLPPKKPSDDINRFILFRRTDDNAMLVYVEGHASLDNLVNISFK